MIRIYIDIVDNMIFISLKNSVLEHSENIDFIFFHSKIVLIFADVNEKS